MKVTTLAYEYNIERRKDRQEIVCFHWEGTDSKNPVPHMHVGSSILTRDAGFTNKSHLPTGRVPVEDLVTFLIDELKVRPARHRKADWRGIVTAARKLFFKFKRW